MSTIHLNETTTATPEQLVAGLTDFGPGRSELFPRSADQYLTSMTLRDAQYDAIVEWGIPDHGALQRLSAIHCPTLIIQGDGDLMIPTRLSHVMAGLIPDAQIRLYRDSAHAFLFQESEQVAADINAFLE